jgi:hypothetical protein
MRFAWHANVEEQEAIVGLVEFLNPSLNQDGSDLVKHILNFGGAQCHVARAPHDREMKYAGRPTTDGDSSTQVRSQTPSIGRHCSLSLKARTIQKFPRIELQIT